MIEPRLANRIDDSSIKDDGCLEVRFLLQAARSRRLRNNDYIGHASDGCVLLNTRSSWSVDMRHKMKPAPRPAEARTAAIKPHRRIDQTATSDRGCCATARDGLATAAEDTPVMRASHSSGSLACAEMLVQIASQRATVRHGVINGIWSVIADVRSYRDRSVGVRCCSV